MGISVGAQEGHHNDYAHTIKRMTRLLRHRQTHVWLWRPFTFGLSPSGREHNKCVKVVHNFTEKVRKRLFKERVLTWKRTMEIAYAMEQASESAVEASHGHLNTEPEEVSPKSMNPERPRDSGLAPRRGTQERKPVIRMDL
uniref:Uncharacterized protein n=1 Tax=Timema monikensis TaxID=170555 RepID=A0A7R9E5D6_9NEOP|nr:unnamed protein product [Timema monikensis]